MAPGTGGVAWSREEALCPNPIPLLPAAPSRMAGARHDGRRAHLGQQHVAGRLLRWAGRALRQRGGAGGAGRRGRRPAHAQVRPPAAGRRPKGARRWQGGSMAIVLRCCGGGAQASASGRWCSGLTCLCHAHPVPRPPPVPPRCSGYAHGSYAQVLGEGHQVAGDAVVPTASALLEGSTHVVRAGQGRGSSGGRLAAAAPRGKARAPPFALDTPASPRLRCSALRAVHSAAGD